MSKDKLLSDINLRIIFSVTLMSAIGIAAVNPALPSISGALHVPTERIGLLIAVFAFPGIIFNPFIGILADRFGRKKILIPGLLLFGLAGLLCGFVRDFNLLLIIRFIQGIGGASLGSLNLTLIADLYNDSKRDKIMGINNSILSTGTAIFPIIGGLLTFVGWYYTFFIDVIAVPIALAAVYRLKETEQNKFSNMRGYFAGIAENIKDIKVIAVLFVSFTTFFMLFGVFLNYLPFLIKFKFIDNPVYFGLMITGMSIVQALIASQTGKILKKAKPELLIVIAFLLYSLSMYLFTLMPEYWMLFLPTTLLGAAQALNVPVGQLLLASYVAQNRRAVFFSFYRTMNNIGQALGPLILGFVYFKYGLSMVFYFGSIAGLLSSAILFITLKK